MQKLIIVTIFFNLLFLHSSFALEQIGHALVRSHRDQLVEKQVLLKDLYSLDKLEGKYFKIVEGTNQEAIRFSEQSLIKKATHAYYHATIAREAFIQIFGEKLIQDLPPVVIRIEMNKVFDDTNHFLLGAEQEEFNNALSIPASDQRRHPKVGAWGPEMWFRSSKEIKLDNGVYLTADALTDPQIRALFYESIATSTAAQMTRDLSSVFWDFSLFNYQTHLTTMAISLGVLEILPRVVKFSTKKIKRKVYMDSVRFPEIIYHEFGHIAFSKLLPLNNFNPVTEGYANYFASLVTHHHKLMYKGKNYAKGLSGKNAKSFQQYGYDLEAKVMAQSSFTFKLLYDLKQKLGEDLFHQILIKAATHPLVFDSIKFGLITALFESVDDLEIDQKEMVKFKIHSVMRELAL